MKLPEWEQSFGRLVAGALQRGAEIRLGNLFFGKKIANHFVSGMQLKRVCRRRNEAVILRLARACTCRMLPKTRFLERHLDRRAGQAILSTILNESLEGLDRAIHHNQFSGPRGKGEQLSIDNLSSLKSASTSRSWEFCRKTPCYSQIAAFLSRFDPTG